MDDDRKMVLVDRAPGVWIVTFNRPMVGNALSPAMVGELTEVFRSLSHDRAVRAVLIRGDGAHFCTGGDVRDFARLVDLPVAERRTVFASNMAAANAMILAFAAIEIPIVVACRGTIAGGGIGLVLAADLVLADATAILHFSQLRFGLPPDGAISALLPEMVGDRRARELVLSAASIDAENALRLGLVSRIVDAADLMTEAIAVTGQLARGPADALRATKRMMRPARDHRLAARLAAERAAIIEAVGHPDFEEGVRAFLDRRSPDFPSSGQSGDR